MKRKKLAVDDKVLKEALPLSTEVTYPAALDPARRARAGKILSLAGSGLWEGELSAMRGDVRSQRSLRPEGEVHRAEEG